ncbi:MAG: WG repeat-containing protein [Veillonella sp.]|nr:MULTISPECIES: WG repeat-containing protein [Veillonella]MDU7714959.1 WG repeat-containing protein [Veillonella sp.]MDU8948802.1 WG repeat-containing protein [Veillonella sp.]
MKKFILGLAIALAACNITSAKEYITLESPAGNTIVDEKGTWILGPYNNLHVEYIDEYNNKYVYGSFYENGQKRYVNLVELAYLPAGYEYQFDYALAKALTNGGFKLVNSNGTYAINDVVNQYSTINKNLILGKKGDYWYLYNQNNGTQILTNPITNGWDNIEFYWSKNDKKNLFEIHTADGLIKYVTDEGILLSESEALNLIHTNNYEKSTTGEGTGYGDFSSEKFFSRSPSNEYVLFTEIDKKGNTLYGMRTNENTLVIPAVYTSIKHLGKKFDYFVATDKNRKYGIIDSLNKTVVPFEFDSYERLSDRSFVLKHSKGVQIFNADLGILYNDGYDSIDTSKPNYVLNKVTTATKGQRKYVINTNSGYGLFQLPNYDDDITSFYKDLFVYKSNGKYGLMDYEGNIIIEPKFDKVTIDEPELAEYIKTIESYDK